MVGIIQGLKKELLLVARRPKDILLVIMFPLLIILAFGGLYTETMNHSYSVALYVDEATLLSGGTDNNNVVNTPFDFFAQFEQMSGISPIRTSSERQVSQLVLSNTADVGIVIKKSQGDTPYAINVIIDSTDFAQANLIKGIMSYQISAITTDFSIAMLQRIYSQISQQESIIDAQQKKLNEFIPELKDINQATNESMNNAKSFDVNQVRTLLQQQISELRTIKSNISDTEAVNDDIINQVNYMKSSVYAALDAGPKTVDASGNTVYNPPGSSIDLVMKSYPDSINSKAASQKDKFATLESKTDDLITQAQLLDQNISSSSQGYTTQLKSFIQKSQDLENQIGANLSESQELLTSLKALIESLKQYSPQFLAKPMQLNFVDVIKIPNVVTQFFAVVFSLVLMFTGMLFSSLAVIREKNWGIEKRLKMMPIHKSSLILEKLGGAFILLGLIISVMLFIGTQFFGITTITAPLDTSLVFALIIICFVSIGLAIGTLMDNESSTILTILALAFPMIFLSGVLVPTELMISGTQYFNSINPLSASITLLTNTCLKGLPLVNSTQIIAELVIITIVTISIAYKKYF